jgi:hypothetical protein
MSAPWRDILDATWAYHNPGLIKIVNSNQFFAKTDSRKIDESKPVGINNMAKIMVAHR